MAERLGPVEPHYTWDSSDVAGDVLLVIGNGFDIECGLPTRYSDFLDFAGFLEMVFCQLYIPINSINAPEDIDELGSVLSPQGLSKLKAAFEPMTKGTEFNPTRTYACLRHIVDNDPSLLNDIAQHISDSYWRDFIDVVPGCLRHEVPERMSAGNIPLNEWMPLFENYWYKHFKSVQIGKDWVDFEAEIARVIRTLENSMIDGRAHRAYADDAVSCRQPYELEDLNLPGIDEATASIDNTNGIRIYPTTYRKVRDVLLNDLKVLTDRLECYLRDYVEGIAVEETSAISHMLDSLQGIDAKNVRVLNFNYTSTIDRFLDKRGMGEAITCHVHGQLGGDSHVVLGMDEYLPDDMIAECIDFASFRKYNQRIRRGADNSYMQWVKDQWLYAVAEHEVIIFGHSIGASDWDLLRPLIKKTEPYGSRLEGVRTAVYYYNDDAFSELLANATGMLGRDYVIERTGPTNRTLKFIDQQKL